MVVNLKLSKGLLSREPNALPDRRPFVLDSIAAREGLGLVLSSVPNLCRISHTNDTACRCSVLAPFGNILGAIW